MWDRSARYDVQAEVLYNRLGQGKPAQVGIGWTEDLGERGTCLKLPTALHVGCKLDLVIFTEPDVVEAEGRVVWIRPGGQRTFYYHGVEFVHLTPAYYASLLKALPPKRSLQRRTFRRFPLALPVSCRAVRANTPPLEGQMGNISRGGVMILLPQQIPLRTRVEITLRASQLERIRGKIRWVDDSSNEAGLFRHGIAFARGPVTPHRFLSLFSSTLNEVKSEG